MIEVESVVKHAKMLFLSRGSNHVFDILTFFCSLFKFISDKLLIEKEENPCNLQFTFFTFVFQKSMKFIFLLSLYQSFLTFVLEGVGHIDNLQMREDAGRTQWNRVGFVYTRVSQALES